MHHLMTLFTAVLFVVLCPGVLLSLPSNGSVLTKALVHGLVFAVVFYFSHQWAMTLDGFTGMACDCKGKTGCMC